MALDVYLHGKRVGSLHPAGGDYEFAYAEEALEAANGDGAVRLSRSLPLRAEPFAHEEVRAYVEGLLPAGARREQTAAELGLDPVDGYGLIAALGRDCPGAVVFLPEGAPPPRRPDREEIAWLELRELEEVGANPPKRLFDPDRPQRMRFALPGERHKLALVLDRERGWAWPEPGLPSTHILFPEPEERPGFAINEIGCLLALRTIGLPVINAEYAPTGEAGGPGMSTARFDRWGEGVEAERLHSESLSQANGAPADAAPGGEVGATVRSSELLQRIGEESANEYLFKALFCSYLLGSAERSHAENVALIYGEDGPMLAPFYDVSSDQIYEDESVKRPLAEAVRRSSPFVGLAQAGMPCMYGLVEGIELGTETGTELCLALDRVIAGIDGQGFDTDPIEQIRKIVLGRLERFHDEVLELIPPGAGG